MAETGVTGPRKRVTIVGGGASGALFAHHLLRESPDAVAIDIAEERARLGAGVAYSSAEPHQMTNIPAARMSIYPDDRPHFARWLAVHGGAEGESDPSYPNRSAFGRYLDQLVRGTTPAHPASTLHHRRVRVDAITRGHAALMAHADHGTVWAADAVALATGNPVPLPPPPLAHLAADPRVVADPWRPDALADVEPDARVLILGIGLSMGEALAGLRAAGHRGPVVAIARRGRRSARGAIDAPPPFEPFARHRPTTAVGLLRQFRAEVRRAEAAGLSWRSVQAAARADGWALWSSLPVPEKRRAVRHLRPFWEALRHVMPGAVYDLLQAEERAGGLRVAAASLRDLAAAPDGLHATLHRRGASVADVWSERFDLVLNCTGPAYATLTEADPFWSDLAQAGLVRPDQVGLGIAVDPDARAIGRTGASRPDLFVLGTLARGTFGELTGVSELSRLARHAATTLVRDWQSERSATSNHSHLWGAVR